jgi:serine phosphatase RsbU (regulator of sigma subunit)
MTALRWRCTGLGRRPRVHGYSSRGPTLRDDGDLVTGHGAHSPQRLAAVRGTGLLDTEAEESFDRLTALARQLLDAPFAFLTVVDDERSFWKSRLGVGEDGPRQNTLQESFCQYVVDRGAPLVLSDVRTDERTRHNPSIESMGVVAWAGFPVHTPDGHVLGTLCVVDTEVHSWSEDDVRILENLAAIASREVALRAAVVRADDALQVARHERERARFFARIGEMLTAGLELDAVWAAIAHLAVPALGDFMHIHTVGRGGALLPVMTRHRDPTQQRRLEMLMASVDRRVGRGAGPGHVAVSGQSQIVRSLSAQPELLTEEQQLVVEQTGADSSITVPLRARGELIAVLTVVRLVGAPPYDTDDLVLAEAIADRAALALDNALSYAQQRTVSLHLQQALLPQALPQPDHLQVASRYRPAGRSQLVGGDWYDAYLDRSGTTNLVIGDVAGHDTRAAATMGRLRTMVRMAGHDGSNGPAAVLGQVDSAVHTLDLRLFATALVAKVERLNPEQPARARRVRWASAGHPPPLLLDADGRVQSLIGAPGIPLGVSSDPERPEHEAIIPAFGTLLLFTDGLIERPDRDLDTGLAQLTTALQDAADLPLEQLCDHLLDRMLPAGGATDDVALIAVRAHPEDEPRPPEPAPTAQPTANPPHPRTDAGCRRAGRPSSSPHGPA